MKATIMLVAPLLLAACSSAAQMPPSTTLDEAQVAWAPPPASSPTATSTLPGPKDETSSSPAPIHEEQSKGPGQPQAADVQPAFPDRRSVEAMDRLAISIPVAHRDRGDVVTLASDDTFEPGSATPTLSAQWRLDDIAAALAAQSNRKIRVDVYADSLGDPGESRRLSQLRAEVLQDYFVAHGARAEAVEASGLGSAHPLASNVTAEGRRTNRRIEIIVEREGR